VTERRSGSSFLEGLKPESRSGTFFPGIGITNTTPSHQIFDYPLRSGTFFKRKLALVTVFLSPSAGLD
jgi:hypothetical protein